MNPIPRLSRNRISITPVENQFNTYRKRSYINADFINDSDSAKITITKTALESEIYGCQTAYQTLKPVIWVMRVLGILPIYNIAPGIFKFSMGSLPMLYCVLLYLALAFALVQMLLSERQSMKRNDDRFEQTVTAYLYDMQLLPFLVIPVMWYETQNVVLSFNRWSKIERLYKRVKGNPINMTFDNKPITFAILLPIIAILTALVFYVTQGRVSILRIAIHSYILSTLYIFTGFWYLQCEILGVNANIVSTDFEKILSNIGPASKISEYRALWIRLSNLTSNLGMASCYTVNSLVLYSFIIITMSTYSVMGQIQLGLGFEDIGLLAVGLSSILILYFLCNEAHYVIQNVRTDFQKRLLAVQLPWMSEDVYTEVSMFLKVFVINPSTISLGGFVNINRSLFRSIMSTMVTYMVILLQFQITITDDYKLLNGTNLCNRTKI